MLVTPTALMKPDKTKQCSLSAVQYKLLNILQPKCKANLQSQKKNFHYTRDITPTRVTSSGRLDNTAPKKRYYDGKLLGTLFQFRLVRESNPRPPAPIAMFSTTALTFV